MSLYPGSVRPPHTKGNPSVQVGQICPSLKLIPIQSGAAACLECFVMFFLKIFLACVGSMAASVQPNGLGNSQKTCHETFGTSCRTRLYNLLENTFSHGSCCRPCFNRKLVEVCETRWHWVAIQKKTCWLEFWL